jgi:hypothetical protein
MFKTGPMIHKPQTTQTISRKKKSRGKEEKKKKKKSRHRFFHTRSHAYWSGERESLEGLAAKLKEKDV